MCSLHPVQHPVDRSPTRAVRCASMKKRVAKKKPAAKPGAAKKKTSTARARKPAAKTAGPTTTKVAPYTPAPLQGDGWPPFRYPLQ